MTQAVKRKGYNPLIKQRVTLWVEARPGKRRMAKQRVEAFLRRCRKGAPGVDVIFSQVNSWPQDIWVVCSGSDVRGVFRSQASAWRFSLWLREEHAKRSKAPHQVTMTKQPLRA